MNRGLVCDEECAPQKISFSLDAAVEVARTVIGEGWSALMAKKTVAQFVTDVAALAARMMRVIVNNSSLDPARDRDGGED